jgi:hypothetical protein
VVLKGRGTDVFGRVARLEWDAGGAGTFREAPGGILAIKLPTSPTAAYPCVLRVTDDDGQVGLDTLRITVVPYKRLAPSKAARLAHVFEAVGGKLYALGGRHADVAPMVEEYDPAADAWRFRSPMPTPRAEFASASVDGRIYTLGGRSIVDGKQILGPVLTVESYEPATDTWHKLAPVPLDLPAMTTFGYQGRVYLFGEVWRSGRLPVLLEYDPGTDAWRELPAPKYAPSAVAVVGDRIFCLVNENQPRYVVRLHEFDLAGNVFTEREPLSSRAGGYRTAVVDGKLLLLGGTAHDRQGATERVDVYHPDRNAWTSGRAMGVVRSDHAVVSFDGRVFLHGGTRWNSWTVTDQQELDVFWPL